MATARAPGGVLTGAVSGPAAIPSMGVSAATLVSLLQDVSRYGDDTEVAVAAHLSVPIRQEVMGVAADREVRGPDDHPPLLWLIAGAGPGVDPYAPRHACMPPGC